MVEKIRDLNLVIKFTKHNSRNHLEKKEEKEIYFLNFLRYTITAIVIPEKLKITKKYNPVSSVVVSVSVGSGSVVTGNSTSADLTFEINDSPAEFEAVTA